MARTGVTLALLTLLGLALRGQAFAPAPRSAVTGLRLTTSPSLVTRSAKAAEPANDYWEGDWVCADCGYVYDRDECDGMYFEEQPRGFKCPQCRGPRRRYAKKVGDRVGLTLDGGDAPILLFSFGGLALTVAFGFWAINGGL